MHPLLVKIRINRYTHKAGNINFSFPCFYCRANCGRVKECFGFVFFKTKRKERYYFNIPRQYLLFTNVSTVASIKMFLLFFILLTKLIIWALQATRATNVSTVILAHCAAHLNYNTIITILFVHLLYVFFRVKVVFISFICHSRILKCNQFLQIRYETRTNEEFLR